jgi:hypothetical protein
MQKCVPFCVLGHIFTEKLGLLGPGRGLLKKKQAKRIKISLEKQKRIRIVTAN